MADTRIPIAPDSTNSGHHYGSADPNVASPSAPPAYYNDKPPDYQDCTDPNSAPPSYDSLYGEFRSVRSPSGFVSFIRKVIGIIIGTVLAAVMIAIVSMIPIAMIVIGSLNLKNCPLEPFIPIYLVVGGAFGLLKSITNFYYRLKAERSETAVRPEDRVTQNPFDGIINCFLLGWFIAGTYWVYHTYHPQFNDPDSQDFCDPLTYWFTFTFICVCYTMAFFFVCCMCCCGCVALCFGPGRSESQ